MQYKDLERSLRLKIKAELDYLNPMAYPNFHSLIQSRDGYLKAEEMVIDYAIKNTLPISSSIAHLESEMG